jgi:hypothetical protein
VLRNQHRKDCRYKFRVIRIKIDRSKHLRLDTRNIFTVGKVDIRSVDTDVKVLYNDAVGLDFANQVVQVDSNELCNFFKFVTNLEGLEFLESCRAKSKQNVSKNYGLFSVNLSYFT